MKNILCFVLCFILSLTKAYAMERPDGFLSPEEIENYNTGLLARTGAKINHSFNPEKVENIVVGCDIQEHNVHFFGGPFKGANTRGRICPHIFQGNLIDSPTERRDHASFEPIRSLPPYLFIDGKIGEKLTCTYHFAPCTTRFDNKKLERGFHTTDHAEALKYALSEESGQCRQDREPSPWEVDPEKSIYIDFLGREGGIHIQGDFAEIEFLPFFQNIKKIIIEYYHYRDETEHKRIIQNAYNILAPEGVLLLEVGPLSDDNPQSNKFTPEQVIGFSLPNFQLEKLTRNTIPARGKGGDRVYTFRAVKK